ncbi:MAG: DUF881 domain-containing protein [bacterium]
MLKKSDYILLGFISFIIGIFLVSQVYASKKTQIITQPENNEVLALEVAKLTRSNADLRVEVQSLTRDSDTYKNKSTSSAQTYEKFQSDLNRMNSINGVTEERGQGVIINISGQMSVAQVVDFVNAIKNIGSEILSINDTRLVLSTDLSIFANSDSSEIKILGNSNLLKSAIERKGGILDLIASKSIKVNIATSDDIVIPASHQPLEFKYLKFITK